MVDFIEKILFQKFSEMPKSVRVLTYLVVLVVFVYLLLIPRFIDGHLSIKDPATGRMVDFRGGELRMTVDARTYKYTASEYGIWSIPIVSRLLEGVEFEVHDPDTDTWHCVKLGVVDVWGKKSHKLELVNTPPYCKVVSSRDGSRGFAATFLAMGRWFSSKPAEAAEIRLPAHVRPTALTPQEKARIQQSVTQAVAKATGKKASEVGPNFSLTGTAVPSYVQRIEIIRTLESEFSLAIPDEHWKSLGTVAELADYMEKRLILVRAKPNVPRDWEGVQKMYATGERPQFMR